MPEPVSLEKVNLFNTVPAAKKLTSVIARNKDELIQDFPGIDIRYSNVFRAIRSLNRARKNPEIEAYLLRTHFAVVGLGSLILNRTIKIKGHDDEIHGINVAFWLADDDQSARNSAAKQMVERAEEIKTKTSSDVDIFALLRPGDADASHELANFMYPTNLIGQVDDYSEDDQSLAGDEVRVVYLK